MTGRMRTGTRTQGAGEFISHTWGNLFSHIPLTKAGNCGTMVGVATESGHNPGGRVGIRDYKPISLIYEM